MKKIEKFVLNENAEILDDEKNETACRRSVLLRILLHWR